MSWKSDNSRHSFASRGTKTRKSVINRHYQPLNHITHAMMLKDRKLYYPNSDPHQKQAFTSDPDLMVKVSGIMEYLFSDTSLDDKQREAEARAYQFAYDYIRGATKHYTKTERESYFANPRMIYYLNVAYLENVTPDAYDSKKRDHYMRNYKRGLKELERRMRKLAMDDERIKAQQVETLKAIDGYRSNMTQPSTTTSIFGRVIESMKSVFGYGSQQSPSPFQTPEHINDPLFKGQGQTPIQNTQEIPQSNVVVEGKADVPIQISTGGNKNGTK